jgi:aspartyl-tRNA(Asn)/glutamyl-tRNA(Gln) amidotransferase subunit A
MPADLTLLTIAKAREMLDSGEISAVDLANAHLAKIKKENPSLNAYLEVYADVLDQAKAADAMIKSGKIGPLTGIPLSVKDNILIKGRTASSASKMLEKYTASYDATVIAKLKAQGAVFLGRTNMDEFAMGGSTENSAFGPTKNPHDTSRVPGGSSGGAAASVAAHLAVAALGSDTGGSIRQPASFCGVVGLKPTYGAVSRYGVMAMASSLDQIGPITKTVEDAEILFNTIAGQDRFDSTSITRKAPAGKKESAKKFVVGVPWDFLEKGVDEDVLKNFKESVEALKKAGAEIRTVAMPNLKYALATYYVLMPAEVSSNLARFDGVRYGLHSEGATGIDDYLATRREGFGPEVRRRIILGTYVLSTGYYDAYYNKANQGRQLIMNDFSTVFAGGVDVILTPTSPVPAFKIGEKSADPLSMYLADIFTVSANIATVPAISIPSGFTERDGAHLPLGIQFTAPYGREDALFSIGRIFEQTTNNGI